MSGQWPPEWEDDEEFPEGEDQPDAATQARLSEVTAYLASVPAPILPDDVEARISAALEAEAAGPGTHGPSPERALGPSPEATLGPAPGRARVRRRSGDGPRHRRGRTSGGGRRPGWGVRPLPAAAVVVICLLLVGLGFGLSLGSGSSSSSSAESGAPGTSSSTSSGAAAEGAVPGAETPFVVTQSGTEYQATTLAGQVRAKLARTAEGAPERPGVTTPAAEGASPNPTLSGCVLQVTGGATPRLVDRAYYQGEPVYVIADSQRVWVVGLGCTAVKTDLIASVPLSD